jgi:hypothetical protein
MEAARGGAEPVALAAVGMTGRVWRIREVGKWLIREITGGDKLRALEWKQRPIQSGRRGSMGALRREDGSGMDNCK